MSDNKNITDLWGNEVFDNNKQEKKITSSSKASRKVELLPEKLGKAIKLTVPDFSDPNRKLSCLEADFPITQINALSNLEGNAGKPIYQMSKWWARRRSSVFRSMMIAAATETPIDHNEASKLVWDHYYCNHQKAGSFKKLRVLDCFMGGGTTLVEGSRLGMQMAGVDLNPVAWFVVKNELACSDPEQVKGLFEYIEKQVKPQIQPFYTTTCPRGHKGQWIDLESGEKAEVEPIELPPDQRYHYQWEGPEVIYAFWAKHGPCQAKGCGHRTPIFRSSIIAEKNLSTNYIEFTCPKCASKFNAELGETRMAPGVELIVIEDQRFSLISQGLAKQLNDYDKGTTNDTLDRCLKLKELAPIEKGFCCPNCGTFSGKKIIDILDQHGRHGGKPSARKKSAFKIQKKKVQMYLILHPKWMQGSSGLSENKELGGWAGAPAISTDEWFNNRLTNLTIIEVRTKSLPDLITLADGTIIETGKGTIPVKAHFTCGSCGLGGKDKNSEKNNNTLEAVRQSGHTAPVAAYTLQCHCPQCDAEGYNYGGRYFKIPDGYDISRINAAEKEWESRCKNDLNEYWPKAELWNSYMTHKLNGGIPNWGYTHWWKMFNTRQLLVHSQILKSITGVSEETWPLDVKEQVLGAFQQYLRNQNMFCFWDNGYDKLVPMMSNANFHPKNLVIENCVFNSLGRGNWQSSSTNVLSGVQWAKAPWELVVSDGGSAKSEKGYPNDPIIPGNEPYCGSSTDLSMLGNEKFDLVITDPPFGNNLFYADLADFFYVWLQIPLRKWYSGLPEASYFEPNRTPHSMEAIDNCMEHPDDREEYEKDPFIESKHLDQIRKLTSEESHVEKDKNPLFRPQPSSDFYSQTLSAVWAESGRRLKDGGIMAFTFHHNEDSAWVDVLMALFKAGYLLVATYPIRSDETKGDTAAFGSRKIEYDIIHVCRKRIVQPEPVSWSRMRRWVKDESKQLKELLEHTHGKTLPESDLRVILRGKSLEFYSRHYGQVLSGDGQILDVRDALLGINQLLDDLLEDNTKTAGLRPPESAEPMSRLYLRLFKHVIEMDRDELHKTLRGTGFSQGDLESRDWIHLSGRIVRLVPIKERFAFFTVRGRNRKVIKSDLDQAHFLIGAAFPNSGLKIEAELNNPNFRIKKSVDEILRWYAEVDQSSINRLAAKTANQLVESWRKSKGKIDIKQLSLFERLEESE
jgi:hypothetical protein